MTPDPVFYREVVGTGQVVDVLLVGPSVLARPEQIGPRALFDFVSELLDILRSTLAYNLLVDPDPGHRVEGRIDLLFLGALGFADLGRDTQIFVQPLDKSRREKAESLVSVQILGQIDRVDERRVQLPGLDFGPEFALGGIAFV